MPDAYAALRIFLDANVLISASLSDHSRFRILWRMRGVSVVVSPYAIMEARRHLTATQLEILEALLAKTHLCADPFDPLLPEGIHLVEKDQPVLAAALEARVDYLLTGDKRHFGHLYDRQIRGMYICQPGVFLLREAHRITGDPLA